MYIQRSRYLFFLMFSLFLLLNLNVTILRSLRNTLAVVDLGSGAHVIPFFELFGAMPGAFLMAWGLALLMKHYSIEKVFLVTLSIFLGFFVIFALFIYPSLSLMKQSRGVSQLCSLLFYVMCELWKPALAMILFWGLVNQYVPLSVAKKLYAPLMLGGSLGSVIAGPVISLCTSETVWKRLPLVSERWAHSFNLMITLIFIIGAVSGFFYYRLWKFFSQHFHKNNHPISSEVPAQVISLKDSIVACLQSRQLRLLSWIVIADYIAYSLGEVIFLDLLKLRFPQAADYCHYMGYLALWSGILTVISSLFVTPFILQRCRWVTASLITPLCLLVTEGIFFIVLREKTVSSLWFGWTEAEWIQSVVLLGAIQYCLCRGAKYTLFDASKELAFVLMPDFQRMKGKLVVDGLCARLGRGGAAVLSMGLIQICGGVMASSLLTGIIAIAMASSWLISTCKLGKFMEKDYVFEK